MVIADFELKAAYIEGAKAALSGMAPRNNPFREAGKREFWTMGYRTVTTGGLQPVSYFPERA